MGIAKQRGGLYYVGGVAKDAHGAVIPGAPPLGPDTPASEIGPVVQMVAGVGALAPAPAGPTAAELDALVTAKATEIAAKIVEQKLAELTAPSSPEAPAAGAPQSK